MKTLEDKNIGFALTGSHCTLDKVLPALETVSKNCKNIYPIMSKSVTKTKTKFGSPEKWIKKVEEITNSNIINSIPAAEPIGPGKLLDLLIIAPCTGNTMAKISNGIIDETVVMAAKAQLRNMRPILIAVATNDALGLNATNLASLLNTRHIYFVPFGQDNIHDKPNSLIARMDLIYKSAQRALEGHQIQPILIEYRGI